MARRSYGVRPFVGTRHFDGGFSPLSLFSAGEQGAWYDPSDLSTLFSDSAGTTPAVVDGPVGKMLDKSGRGTHRTQATTAQTPILRTSGGLYWLEYDGVDDGMVTASIDLSGTAKATVIMGARKDSDASAATLVEFSAWAGQTGAFGILAPRTASANYGIGLRGDTAIAQYSANSLAAGSAHVLAVQFDIAGAAIADEIMVRVNGAAITPAVASAGPAGGGNFGNYPLYFGRRAGASQPFTGREYYAVIRGAVSSAAQIASLETACNLKTGAY